MVHINRSPSFFSGDGIVTTPAGGPFGAGFGVQVQPDGAIVVAGVSFDDVFSPLFTLVRYNADGSLDTGFGGGDGIVTTPIGTDPGIGTGVQVQPDGAIVVAGYSFDGSTQEFALVRYNADGTLDTSFGGGDGIVTTPVGTSDSLGNAVQLQPDGKIVVAGSSFNGAFPELALVRYNADGTLDTSFGGGDGIVTTPVDSADAIGNAVQIQPDGKILVAGERLDGSADEVVLVRYNADGSLDTSFGGGDGIVTTSIGAESAGYGVQVQPDGKIVVAGNSVADPSSASEFALVRYNADGTLDMSFGGGDGIVTTPIGTESAGYSAQLQPDGKIVVAGFGTGGSGQEFALVRYNADGTLDTSFGGGDGIVTTPIGEEANAYSAQLQPDGKILVTGLSADGTAGAITLARYNADGSLDTSFDYRTTLGGTVDVVANGTAIVLDDDVDISDPELDALNAGQGDYAGASLTLARSGGASADDAFGFDASDAFTVSGNALLDGNGQTFATFTEGGGTLVVTFTGSGLATAALADAVARAITYANGASPPPASVQIGWTFSDGNAGAQGSGGAQSATGFTTVNAVNEAPTAVDDPVSVTQRLTITGNLLTNDGDPESDTLTVDSVTPSCGCSTPLSGGSVEVDGLYGTLTLNADGSYSYAADNEDSGLAVGEVAIDEFGYTVSDGHGGESTAYLQISVTGSAFGNAGDNNFYLTSSGTTATGYGGDDFYVVDSNLDRVIEAVNGGLDVVFTSASYVLATGQEIEWLGVLDPASLDAIDLTGNGFGQFLTGNDGDNVLNGAGGGDLMLGFDGNDTYVVDDAADVVSEAVDGGKDRVSAHVSYTLAGGEEIEILGTTSAAGTGAITLIGNGFAQTLLGNAGANVLNGAGGADLAYGFAGDDTYVVDNAGDRVFEAAGGGQDRVNAHLGYILAGGQEIEILGTTSVAGTAAIDLTGNGFDQTLYGNAGANVLNGAGGADLAYGFAGDDTYVVDNAGDRVLEAAGGGSDRVNAHVSYTLAGGQEIETLGTTSAAGTGAIDLTGNGFVQTIYGNAGANILNGAGGADLAFGYGGDDTYVVDNAGDRVFEAANGGADRVNASVSYVLAGGQEVEALGTTSAAGTGAIDLTGNGFDQTLYGNAGDNVLNGAGGADLAYGYGGDDTYVVDHADDRVIEAANAGRADRVNASVSYVLAAGQGIEILGTTNVAGTGAIDLTGNEFAQTLHGNAGANVLDGKAGSDILTGYAGADTFAFTAAFGAGNVDHITDFAVGADRIQLSQALVPDLATGALAQSAFKEIGAGVDADDRILYDRGTGALYYDSNGSGDGGRVQFAVLDTRPTGLTSADFVVA